MEFDFLVDGEFVTSSLEELIKAKSISPEASVSIEYVERFPAPEPEESLNHDDWVSAVHCVNGWYFKLKFSTCISLLMHNFVGYCLDAMTILCTCGAPLEPITPQYLDIMAL